MNLRDRRRAGAGLVVVGAGATGLEVIDIAQAEQGGESRPIRAVDDHVSGRPPKLAQRSVELVGGRSVLADLDDDFVVAVGDPEIRRELIGAAESVGLLPADPIVHPRAACAPGVRLGAGSVVYPNAVLSTDVAVGEHCLVYMLVSLGHDVVLGRNCVITPGVNLSGNVVVEDDVFIGTGAVVVPGIRIGRGATIGAGSVVTKDVEPGVVAFGNPARERRTAR